MTKLILLALVVSLNSFAQTDDGLTLESKTAPTIVEDGTDLSSAPVEEPVEAPDTVNVTETVDPTKDIPAQLPDTSPMELTNKSDAESTVTETEPAETVEASPEVTTPNPIADEEKRPEEEPQPEKIVDQTPPPSVSTPVITTEAPKDDRWINHRKSHLITTFGFEGMKYELPWDFEGSRKNVREREQDLYGGRLGVGGQLYLGAGFFTTSMLEAFYVGTLTKTVQVADPAVEDEEAGSIKRTGGIYGVEIAQQLGHIFEFKTKNPFMDEWTYITFEPFIEAGLGVAQGYHSVHYQYDTGPSGVVEKYKRRITDQITNARIGAGFNVTARTGFFMQARVTVNRYDIMKRRIDTFRKQDDEFSVDEDTITDKDVNIDPITVFTIGGGYKF